MLFSGSPRLLRCTLGPHLCQFQKLPKLQAFSRARDFSSFTIVSNATWEHKTLQLPSVRVCQEIDDWERASEIGLGAVVWDAALAFCDLVESCGHAGGKFWRDKAVLELGAGCGAAGLTLAAKGANVVLTDRAAVLPHLKANLALNTRLAASVRLLDWNDVTSEDLIAPQQHAACSKDAVPKCFDVVLGTDLVSVDPDRRTGQGFFDALCHVLLEALNASPQLLVMLIFEERGHLHLADLGELFQPLLLGGASMWELHPPSTLARQGIRYLCLWSGEGNGETGASGNATFDAWRQLLLETASGRFVKLDEATFCLPAHSKDTL